MTENQTPMTYERRGYLREMFAACRGVEGNALTFAGMWGLELLAEIDRLRAELAAREAENERLREALVDIAYNTSTSIPFAAPPETFIVGQLHSCIGKAARALNPEPAP